MSALLQTEIYHQRFTGYYIPVELDYMDLNACEQKLLSMIDSLEREAPHYCYASNEYLAARLRISESRISFYLTKFKRMGLIEVVGYDGRRRKMRALKENWYKKPVNKKLNPKKELCVKTSSQTDFQKKNYACFHEVRLRESTIVNTKNIPYIDIKEDIKENQPTKPSFQTESGSVVGFSAKENLQEKPTAIPIVTKDPSSPNSVGGFYEGMEKQRVSKTLASTLSAASIPQPKVSPVVSNPQQDNNKQRLIIDKMDDKPYQGTTNKNISTKTPYKCLLNLGISYEDTLRITLKFPEDIVIKAVKYCTSPRFKPRSLDRAIFHFCKNPDHIPPEEKPKLTPFEELQKMFKHGSYYNNAECILTPEYIAFQRGMKNMHVKIDQFFSWDKTKNMCDIFQIEFTRP